MLLLLQHYHAGIQIGLEIHQHGMMIICDTSFRTVGSPLEEGDGVTEFMTDL